MYKKIVTLLFSLIFLQLLEAALDWNITGSGARAAGMGNAFIGLADDATAINWNPGGLTVLEHFEASLVGAGIVDVEEVKYSNSDGYSESDDVSYKHFNMNFLSLAYPLSIGDKKFVIAGAFQKQLDFFAEDSYEYGNEVYDYSSEGGVYTANIGAAYQILPYLSLGATANIWTGSSEWNEEYSIDITNYNDYSYSENSDFSGFNLTLGTLFDMSVIKENVPLKIGAVIKTPFELKYEYFEEWTHDDFWNDLNDEYEEYSYSGTVEMPLMFGIGASYRFGDFFTVSLDFEKRNYSKSKHQAEYDDGSVEESDITALDDDVNQFRFGMEYLLVTDNLIIPLRCGIFNYPTLWADEEWEEASDEITLTQVVGYGLSFGSGLIFESFAFDISCSFLNYENNYTYDFMDGSWYEFVYGNTRAALNLSAILYLDSFTK